MKLTLFLLAAILGVAQVESFSVAAPIKVVTTENKDEAIKEEATQGMYQERAARIVSSFTSTEYNPVPWLTNCHVQTLSGVFLREIAECRNVPGNVGAMFEAIVNDKMSKNDETKYWDRRERIETPDGDFFHVDSKKQPSGRSKGRMILVHGLESNSESNLMTEMASVYYDTGLDVVCINFRGCSGEPNDTLGAYHLGFTDDLIQYLNIVKDDGIPNYLSAFSLGGNMMLKALGDLGAQAVEEYNINACAAYCIPFEVERCYQKLSHPGLSRTLYGNTLIKTMKTKASAQLDRLCGGDEETNKFDYMGVKNAETIFDIENAYIAPIYGFDDAIDYYRKNSNIFVLPNIVVPTFVLNAEDDPFLDGTHQPTELTFEGGEGRAPVKIVHAKHGGHCGFMFHRQASGSNNAMSSEYSWAPTEMGRFIQHVMEYSPTNS